MRARGGDSMSNVTALRPQLIEHVYLSPTQVCELVPGMTVVNLQEMRKNGRGPKYRKPTGEHGKVVIYAKADVLAWVESSVITTREQS